MQSSITWQTIPFALATCVFSAAARISTEAIAAASDVRPFILNERTSHR
jgi:hypothetical protein